MWGVVGGLLSWDGNVGASVSSHMIFGPFYSVYFIHFLTIQIQLHHSHSFQEEHKRFDLKDV